MKKIAVICIIILMIIVICIFAFTGNKKQENNNSQNNIQVNMIQNKQVNETTQNGVENTVGQETKNKVENTVSEETHKQEPQTAQEKAIDIVKGDWNRGYAEFSITGMDNNGNYIVQVTDSNTAVLAFYTVNAENGTFTKREMN